MGTEPQDPPIPPPDNAVQIPLPEDLRAAYEALEDKYETAIENTTDPGVLETLNSSRDNVDDTLTKDALYRIEANTALYEALAQQIKDTNDELGELQKQIQAISSGVSTFADILGAINKVLSLIPGA